MLDASEVDSLPIAQCVPTKEVTGIELGVLNGSVVDDIAGCGWRSVVSIEVHLLLNTIYNSSTTEIEQFQYSIDSNAYQNPSTDSGKINPYKMHRREFITTVTLKNY